MNWLLKLLGGALGPYIASGIAMALVTLTVALGVQTWRIDRLKTAPAKAVAATVAKIEKADAKETVRREMVLQKVQVRSQADIKKIDTLATKLAAAQEESRRASLAHDNDACLSPDSVLRLAAVR